MAICALLIRLIQSLGCAFYLLCLNKLATSIFFWGGGGGGGGTVYLKMNKINLEFVSYISVGYFCSPRHKNVVVLLIIMTRLVNGIP